MEVNNCILPWFNDLSTKLSLFISASIHLLNHIMTHPWRTGFTGMHIYEVDVMTTNRMRVTVGHISGSPSDESLLVEYQPRMGL